MSILAGDLFRRARWSALAAAAALSAACFYFSTAGNHIAFLAWIAPVPILAFAFAGAPPLRLAVAAFWAVFLGNLSWIVLYWGILPAPALVMLAALLALAFAFIVHCTRLVAARLGALAGTIAYPALSVTVEFTFAHLSPHGTAGSVAYSQADFLPLIQAASWAGLSAITFVLGFVAAGLAAAAAMAGGSRLRWKYVVLPALILATVLVAGRLRMTHTTVGGRVTVGLVSVDEGMRRFDTTSRDEAVSVVTRYLEPASILARRGAEVVVMPEKMVGVTAAYRDEVGGLLSDAAEKAGIAIVAGLNEIAPQRKRNVAQVYAKGRRLLEYEKQRLVPGLEAGYSHGSSPGIYRAPGGTTGVAICKDLDFPAIGREYANAGIGILFVPAWDFGRDAWLHSRMAVMRGVEGGFSIARAAANGLLTGSDDLGRIIAEVPSDSATRSALLAVLPLGEGSTFYSRHGDWFGWSCMLAAAGLLAAGAAGVGREGA